jgi:hypothetical protein
MLLSPAVLARTCLLALVGLTAGCAGPDPDLAGACAAFAAFQDALQAGDRDAAAERVTTDSRPALAELPWSRLRREPGLVVQGAERMPLGILVHTGTSGQQPFVVVREHGRLVVDLVATAGLYTEAVGGVEDGPAGLEPRPLDARDDAAIRRFQLAMPPR